MDKSGDFTSIYQHRHTISREDPEKCATFPADCGVSLMPEGMFLAMKNNAGMNLIDKKCVAKSQALSQLLQFRFSVCRRCGNSPRDDSRWDRVVDF